MNRIPAPELSDLQTRYVGALLEILERMPADLGMCDELTALCDRIERIMGFDSAAAPGTSRVIVELPHEPAAPKEAPRLAAPPEKKTKPRSSSGLLCGGARGRHTYSYPPVIEGGPARCWFCGAEQPKGPGYPPRTTTPEDAEKWQRWVDMERRAAEANERLERERKPVSDPPTVADALAHPERPDLAVAVADRLGLSEAEEPDAQQEVRESADVIGTEAQPLPATALPDRPTQAAVDRMIADYAGQGDFSRLEGLYVLLAALEADAPKEVLDGGEDAIVRYIDGFLRFCWSCGCTEGYACPGPCDWAGTNICTACVAKAVPA